MAETIARLRQLHEKFPKDGRYQLLQAQIYLSMGEDEDAKWIIHLFPLISCVQIAARIIVSSYILYRLIIARTKCALYAFC